MSAPELAAALGRMRLQPRATDEAAARARAGHFQLACASAFEAAHGCACDTGINHPNQVRCHMYVSITSMGLSAESARVWVEKEHIPCSLKITACRCRIATCVPCLGFVQGVCSTRRA